MDGETERKIAALILAEAQRLKARAAEEGVRAYLKPHVRYRPNSQFLRATVQSVEYANRVADVNEMWKERELELAGELRETRGDSAERPMTSRDARGEGSGNGHREIQRGKEHRKRPRQDGEGGGANAEHAEQKGIDDSDLLAFLKTKAKRGRGAIGSRADAWGSEPPSVPAGMQGVAEEGSGAVSMLLVRVREEWEDSVVAGKGRGLSTSWAAAGPATLGAAGAAGVSGNGSAGGTDGRWIRGVPLDAWPPAMPNVDCRMYEAKFPEVEQVVMVQVKNIADMGAYVSLLEYNNIEGMILLSELSRRRIRSISSLIKVGRQEPVMVVRVDKQKGYIDLSKRRVSEEEVAACEEKYNKSKMVHSIMRHVAETSGVDVEELYTNVTWPLYRKYGHAFEAFKLVVTDPDAVLGGLTKEITEIGEDGKEVKREVPAMPEDVKANLIANIRRRMTPQPLKIRADIELKCFHYDGVLHIKDAMRRAEQESEEDCAVRIVLVAPPLYVLTTFTLAKDKGIAVLERAIRAASEEIEKHKGKLTVKEAPRAVSDRDDRLLAEHMQKLTDANAEVDGDVDSEDEDEGMGSVLGAMDLLFGKKKTPAEILRENKRMLDRSIRELDRERAQLQQQEKKLVADIKKSAKQGQMGAVRVMAKDLIRTRHQITKFYGLKSQLQGVSLRIQTLKSTQAMADAMRGVTKAMRSMNKQLNLPALQKVMREFEMANERMEMTSEMMGDAIDDAMEGDEEEEETEELINEVLDEIGIDINQQVGALWMAINDL
ncbi:unnamed protein product [Closterium sp. Yama58-4]|nr:unnamed protein product [Closterium sp. Yama58-4]